MKIFINQTAHDLPEPASLADAIALVNPIAPFAVALNLQFVPNSRYTEISLQTNDQIEVIRPVTGG